MTAFSPEAQKFAQTPASRRVAPAGIPEPILRTLNTAAVQALKTPEMAAKLRASGFEPSPTTPEEFRQFIRSESAKFAKIIVDAGIKLEN